MDICYGRNLFKLYLSEMDYPFVYEVGEDGKEKYYLELEIGKIKNPRKLKDIIRTELKKIYNSPVYFPKEYWFLDSTTGSPFISEEHIKELHEKKEVIKHFRRAFRKKIRQIKRSYPCSEKPYYIRFVPREFDYKHISHVKTFSNLKDCLSFLASIVTTMRKDSSSRYGMFRNSFGLLNTKKTKIFDGLKYTKEDLLLYYHKCFPKGHTFIRNYKKEKEENEQCCND